MPRILIAHIVSFPRNRFGQQPEALSRTLIMAVIRPKVNNRSLIISIIGFGYRLSSPLGRESDLQQRSITNLSTTCGVWKTRTSSGITSSTNFSSAISSLRVVADPGPVPLTLRSLREGNEITVQVRDLVAREFAYGRSWIRTRDLFLIREAL